MQARQEAQAFQYGAVFEDDLEHNPAIDLLENHLDELADALINEEKADRPAKLLPKRIGAMWGRPWPLDSRPFPVFDYAGRPRERSALECAPVVNRRVSTVRSMFVRIASVVSKPAAGARKFFGG